MYGTELTKIEYLRRNLFCHGLAYFIIQRIANDKIDQNAATSLRKILHTFGEDGALIFS